ncbi:MAG: hypothetical protein IJ744_12635 [Lachnospiraceae bacterium]|nr:hypothetical protein [Lachnospiraceae bacterium]
MNTRKLMSLLIVIMMLVTFLPARNVSARETPDFTSVYVISESSTDYGPYTRDTFLLHNEFDEVATTIRDTFLDGSVFVTVYEDGEVYTFSSVPSLNGAHKVETISPQAETPIPTKTDKFSTKIITYTVAYVAGAIIGHFAGMPYGLAAGLAASVVQEALDYNLTHVYYTAVIRQTLISDGAVSYYKIRITMNSYRNNARTQKYTSCPVTYFNYDNAYPY